MGRIVKVFGLAGLVFSAGYFLYFDQFKPGGSFDYITRTRDFLLISAGLVVAGYIVQRLETKLPFSYGKCKRCGRRIKKNEMYCYDHLKKAVDEGIDRDHRTGRS
jgi:hypothetical protein